MTGGSAILTELFVVASGLKYSSIAGHGPAGFWVNSIVTVAAEVAQPLKRGPLALFNPGRPNGLASGGKEISNRRAL